MVGTWPRTTTRRPKTSKAPSLALFFFFFHASCNRILNSRSLVATSISSLSTLYCSASRRARTARARRPAPPSSVLRGAAVLRGGGAVAGLLALLLLLRRPALRSRRALRVSMRRAWRSVWRSARSRRCATKGPISSRREASAAERVGWGRSS